jgi:hypothetical protein
MKTQNWKVVYVDGNTIIFVKNTVRNESIIKKYAMSDNSFRLPSFDSTDSLLSLAYFLNLMGWEKAALIANEKIYTVDPNNCRILYNLITQLGPRNPAASIYLNSFFTNRCKK